MSERNMGVIVGIFFGLCLAVLLLWVCNRKGQIRTQYDERQKLVRAGGYKIGFWVITIYECVLAILGIGEVVIPVEAPVLHFGGIICGITALGIYSVWKDAYWGLNNDKRRYTILFVVCGAINLLSGVMSIVDGRIMNDGMVSLPAMNLLCGLMILVLGIALGVKSLVSKDAEEE